MWKNLRREVLALGRPVVLYWITIGLSLLMFTSAVFLTQDNFDSEDTIIMASIWVATLLGVAMGQVVSITRLRSFFFLSGAFVTFIISIYVIAAYEGVLQAMFGEVFAIVLMMMMMLGSIMSTGGFWSLRVNRGLAAGWAPAMLTTAAIIIVSEKSGNDAAWHAGQKYAIWSATTLVVLGVGIILQILFMAARERHRLHRWRTAPEAAELVENRPDPFKPLAGCGSMLMMMVLVISLTGASAIVAPYLWRTGPRDDGDHPTHGDQLGEPEPDPSPNGPPPDFGDLPQQIQRAVKQGVQMGCALLTMLILAVALLIVFGPPTRRQLLLTHLRDPMWPVPPSRRARLHWRLAEIALGDAGIHRKPGDSAKDVALRAVAAFPDVNLEALVTAAEIADRVMYGYAMDAADADTIRRAAEMTYQAVWDTLAEGERLRATYRFL